MWSIIVPKSLRLGFTDTTIKFIITNSSWQANNQANSASKAMENLWVSHWDGLSRHKRGWDMGFLYLHEFNIDMLGERSWHILTRYNLLVGRIFKARIISRSFLRAGLGSNRNYTWAKKVIVLSWPMKRCVGPWTLVAARLD